MTARCGRSACREPRSRDVIPASHRDLVECPPVAALTTIMPDGYPQTSVVWCDFDGECVRVNTMRGLREGAEHAPRPAGHAAVLRPAQPLRYLEVRGTVVEMTEDGARAHLDALASKYAGRPIRYFGDAIPARSPRPRVPVLCRIRPTHVVALDADEPAGRAMTTLRRARDPLRSRQSHLDLLTRPICGVLTTIGADGQPQSSLVWVDLDGECARVNTTLERQKGRNLLARPEGQPARRRPRRHRPVHPDPGRRRARHGGRRRAPRRAHPALHPPPALLRLHLPGRAAGARDAGHLPDPRPADHPRRDPRLRPPAVGLEGR